MHMTERGQAVLACVLYNELYSHRCKNLNGECLIRCSIMLTQRTYTIKRGFLCTLLLNAFVVFRIVCISSFLSLSLINTITFLGTVYVASVKKITSILRAMSTADTGSIYFAT